MSGKNRAIKFLVIFTTLISIIILFLFIKRNTPHNPISPNTHIATINNKEKATSNKSINLVKPYGIFSSSHLIDTENHNSTIESSCNTNQFVNCEIKFHSDSTTRSLPTHKTDADGYTNWYWSVTSLGLSKGVWGIEAVVSYNGIIISNFDSTDLTIN